MSGARQLSDGLREALGSGVLHRLQLAFGLASMVGVSALFHLGVNPEALTSDNVRNTIIAALLAHVVGYLVYRRFDVFPGLMVTGAVLPTFLLSYGSTLLLMLLLRLDYSRLQLIISFVVSVALHLSLNWGGRRLNPYRLAVVPGGEAYKLTVLPGVVWEPLTSPGSISPRAQGVVADLRAELPEAWERYLANCALAGMPVYHFKQVSESLTGKVQIDHLSENTLGSLNPNQLFFRIKQVCDWSCALAGLILMSPLFLAVAVAVKVDSPGPALFRQERVGHRGRIFRVYKFRTMHVDQPEEWSGGGDETQRAMTRESDIRVTRVGAFLRRTRIDELPQVLNILRGDMSWIGPRPEALPLSRWYERELPFYRYRHIVRPGITGWAQVNQGHVTDLDDVLEKLHYDFYYIKNFSPWLDFVVAVRTIAIVITGFGAK